MVLVSDGPTACIETVCRARRMWITHVEDVG